MCQTCIIGRVARLFIAFFAFGFCVVLSPLPHASAAETTWTGADSTSPTNFEVGNNWTAGTPADNLTDDTAVFDVKGSLVDPSLTTDREIHAIKFTSGGWTLGGTSHTLSVGAGGVNYISDSTAANLITANIELAVDSTWIVCDAGANTSRTLRIDGVISGPGGFTKTGTSSTMDNVYGTLKLTALNTYTGQIILDRGGMTNVLDFNSIGNVGGGPSALGAPTTVENGTIKLIQQVAPKYTGTGHATDRQLELAGAGGHAMLYADGSGPLVWNGDVNVTGTGDKVFSLRGSSTAANTFNGLIADGTVPLRFQIYGAGHWTLANDNNSWTGDTRVAYGTLTVTSLADAGVPSALGAATGSNAAIKLGTGNFVATLKYVGTGHSTDRPLQLGDGSGSGAGTIEANGAGALIFTGNVTGIDNGTAKTLTLGGTSDSSLLNMISGVIADGNTALGRTTSLVKSGANTWGLSGDNVYTGTTKVSGGTLIATKPAALPGYDSAGKVSTTASGATLAVRAGAAGEWTSPEIVTLLANTTFAAGSNLGIDVTAGNVFEHAMAIGGSRGLVKLGAGTLTLSGANAYTGNTTVSAGTLLVHGTHTGGGEYTVLSGATLGGTGTIGGATTVNAGAFLAPGASLGMLALFNNSDLTLDAGSTLLWEFLEAGAAGVDYDSVTGPKLVLPETGKVNLSILALNGYELEAGDSFTLFHGDVFEHGATEPFALGADLTDYFHVTDNIGWWGTWEVTAGSLVLTAVPEPGTCLMLTCLLAFGLLARRRS